MGPGAALSLLQGLRGFLLTAHEAPPLPTINLWHGLRLRMADTPVPAPAVPGPTLMTRTR